MCKKGKKHVLRFCFLIGLTVLTLFSGAARGEDLIKIGGVGSALGAMKLIAAAFEKSHPGIKVQVLPSLGSSGGIKAVLQGALDIGLSGRLLKDDEKGEGAVAIEFARTPFIFITTKDIQKAGLTTQELEKIYGGQIQKWPDGTRIRLVLRPEGDSDTNILKGLSPGMSQAVKSALARKGMAFAVTDQENVKKMEKMPGAFGLSTLTQIITENAPFKILSFNGVKPNVKALADGSYPLFKPLFLVTVPAKTPPTARQFIAFVQSPAGRKILANSGNLSVEGKSGL
ncbi:MAG: phosphate transport system substrate-binding [Geobacteraceae bacterium]|nr:MAG: phosphate transport system substrate-binding [Geobacteraceae bacterium]